MIKFKDFITEEKQVGIIYHYTSIENAVRITDSGMLRPINYEYVSFTRNKTLHITAEDSIHTECRFVVDGTKLSRNYKVTPFNYFNAPHSKYYAHDPDSDEQEERVKGAIKVFPKYVIRLEIYESDMDQIFHFSEDHEFSYLDNPEKFFKRFSNKFDLIKFFRLHYITHKV